MNKRTNLKIRLVILVVLLAVLSGTADGAVIWVPDNYDTIQEALNAADSDDTVMVRAGTYVENIIWPSVNGIELRSESGPNDTIIDGNETETGSVISLGGTAGTNTVIDGFTIRNAADSGISCRGSSATITNNTITGNHAVYGGGINCWASSVTITNNTISGNIAEMLSGGIFCECSDPNITNNTITGNYTEDSGGGICCWDGSSPTIQNNTISDNYGGGIDCWDDSSPTIINNTITGNHVMYGGGIDCWYGSSPTITNNTISNNSSWYGGGIGCIDSSPTMTGNTITGNSSKEGGGIYCDDSDPNITNCILWNDSPDEIYVEYGPAPTVAYSDVQGGWPGEGNINADPCFMDADANDFHLRPDSPCIDTGDPNYVPEPNETDIDGEPRVMGGRVDMGADEYVPILYVDCNAPGPIHDGNSWESAFLTIQEGIDAAYQEDGGEVWVAECTYVENISLREDVYVYGGFSGSETEREQRDWVVNETIIDGNRAGNVVTVTEVNDAIIDGFTITDGNGTFIDPNYYGGGIYCYESSPTIRNNTISGNYVDVPTIGFKGYGGGICCDQSSPIIQNNTISWNNYHEEFAIRGGGICCIRSSPAITNNNINGNSGELGGGICCYDGSNPTIIHNTISDNLGLENGCGIYCHNSGPNVINNTINGSRNIHNGGGIICYNSNPNITGNTISGNKCGYEGGGIVCYNSDPTITNNTISDHGDGDDAGGIFCKDGSSPIIQSNTITGNRAYEDGGGIYCSNSDPNIINNIISGNRGWNGGGIVCLSSSPTITNNTISDSTADGSGGGIYCYNSDPNITNCILWSNSPNEIYVASGSPIVTYSDVQGGWAGEGNIDADPCFVDSGGNDYHLTWESPCIDAGDNTAVSEPNDLEGRDRVVDGDCNGTATVDMGAYEFGFSYIGDFEGDDCDVDFGDFAVFAMTWLLEDGEAGYNPVCDISVPADETIDMLDLYIFAEHWLEGTGP